MINRQNDDKGGLKGLRFVFFSNTAEKEEREVFFSSIKLMESFIEDISNQNWSPKSAKALFELLIPNDFKQAINPLVLKQKLIVLPGYEGYKNLSRKKLP